MNRIKAVLQKCWQYEIVHAAVYSALLNMLVECFNRRSLIGLVMIFTNPVLFLYNTLIIKQLSFYSNWRKYPNLITC